MNEIQLRRDAVSDANAFAELFRMYVTRVYRYHMAHIGNVKDAQDLTSQTFIAALESIRSFRGSGSFAAWVMGIASKKTADVFSRTQARVLIGRRASLSQPQPAH